MASSAFLKKAAKNFFHAVARCIQQYAPQWQKFFGSFFK
jgi:hypothetical protein